MNRRPPPRMAEVIRTQHHSPHLLCITFSGDDLLGFPVDHETANVKLLLPQPHQDNASYLNTLAGHGDRPLKRTYTVLDYRQSTNELDIMFALHENPGPATRWAMQCRIGDSIAIAGPSRVHAINSTGDWFLLAGDLSALPAIIANCRKLSAEATGHVVIETISEQEKPDFGMPAGMSLHWVINPQPASKNNLLINTLKNLHWPQGSPSVWLAGETGFVRAARTWLIENNVDRAQRYTSGYWLIGHNEDAFQPIKRGPDGLTGWDAGATPDSSLP